MLTFRLVRPWTPKEVTFLRLHYGRQAPEPWDTWRLARDLGRTLTGIHRAARRFGLTRRRATVRYVLVARFYHQGLPDVLIAALAGCWPISVGRWRRLHGLPGHGRPSGRRSAEQRACLTAQAVQLLTQGSSVRQVAGLLGVAPSTLGIWLKERVA